MQNEVKIPTRYVTANLKGVKSYNGVAYGISVLDPDGNRADVLVVGPNSQAVVNAIHSAWPGETVNEAKMSRVVVMSASDVEDEEL